MPSLRKRVSSYLRQLSFHNEPRDKRHNVNENSFVTKYLQGQITLKEGPEIIYGKNPTDLPNYELARYDCGPDTLVGCYSGPNGGLTTVRRTEKHLSVLDADIDFIDTPEEIGFSLVPQEPPKKSPQRKSGQPIDNTKMVIKVAGNEYCVTNEPKKSHNKSHSLGSLGDFNVEIEKTRIDKEFYRSNNNCDKFECKNKKTVKPPPRINCDKKTENYRLAKSKSEGNPFNKKRGKIIKIAQRTNIEAEEAKEVSNVQTVTINDSSLPPEWNRKSEHVYGLSDSLYDRNQVTKNKNGDPIADCFGIIARKDSAILAVADGVNWGEKACIAAKSAVHGCLHYLDKTLFNDTKPFDNLTVKTDDSAPPSLTSDVHIRNTREVFVCLLRAFNCAHDLILENKGMLTTLTVAIVLPLKQNGGETRYVCCVCNVGDTLAYVYSQRFGVRELTKGSHDINCNRDMRDALGALGPVDGINPELSNLTLSITILNKGDIVMVASDGLTDNFDPNVCKFTVNSTVEEPKKPQRSVKPPRQNLPRAQPTETFAKPPIKPPRKSKNRDDLSRSSQERASIKSNSLSIRSTSTVDSSSTSSKTQTDKPEYENPLVAQFMQENSHKTSSLDSKEPIVIENKASSLRKQSSHKIAEKTPQSPGYKFLRSKTSIDFRPSSSHKTIPRNPDGIPFVTPIQRYEIQLLLMEDVLKNGISGRDSPCTTAKKLCENLISFTLSITSAKRHTLEDPDLYFDNRNGLLVEVTNQEKKVRRKKGLEKVQNLPGKLDHVTVVAYSVGHAHN